MQIVDLIFLSLDLLEAEEEKKKTIINCFALSLIIIQSGGPVPPRSEFSSKNDFVERGIYNRDYLYFKYSSLLRPLRVVVGLYPEK